MNKRYYTVFFALLLILPVKTTNAISDKIMCGTSAGLTAIGAASTIYFYKKMEQYNSILADNKNLATREVITTKRNTYKNLFLVSLGLSTTTAAITLWKAYTLYKNSKLTSQDPTHRKSYSNPIHRRLRSTIKFENISFKENRQNPQIIDLFLGKDLIASVESASIENLEELLRQTDATARQTMARIYGAFATNTKERTDYNKIALRPSAPPIQIVLISNLESALRKIEAGNIELTNEEKLTLALTYETEKEQELNKFSALLR